MRVGDVAGRGPGIDCTTHRRIPFYSRNEDLKCVSMTWRAISARPYLPLLRPLLFAVLPHQPLALVRASGPCPASLFHFNVSVSLFRVSR